MFDDQTKYNDMQNANLVAKMMFSLRERPTTGDGFENTHKNPNEFVRNAIGKVHLTDDKMHAGLIRTIPWGKSETKIYNVYGNIYCKHLDDVQRRGG